MIFRLLLAFACLVPVSLVVAQGPVSWLTVTDVDPTGFPYVEARFRAVDDAGRHVPGIERTAVALRDGETDATAEFIREEDGPLSVHFVIETGQVLNDSDWEAAMRAISHFANGGWMAEGDTVAISFVSGRDLLSLLPSTTSVTDISSLSRANPNDPAVQARALTALGGLTGDMAGQSDGQAQAIVFITPQLWEGTDVHVQTLASQARDAGIPIFTVTTGSHDDRLAQLAAETGGVFTAMGTAHESMSAAYDDLAARRRQYAVGYRVTDNAEGTRNITIGVPGAATTAAGATSYEIAIDPPEVLIQMPDPGEIIERTGQAWDADPAASEPTTLPVVAVVGFGLAPERRIRSAVLEVDGVEVDRINNPPRGDSAAYEIPLTWDMRSVVTPGDTAHTLIVEVVDELGERDNAAVEVTVRVTMPPEPTRVPDNGGGRTVAPIDCWSPPPWCERVERPIRENPLAAISLLVALLALIFAAVIWATRGSAPVQRMTQTVRKGIDRLTNRYRRAEVRAYLEVLGGTDEIGRRYEIYGDTPIGRSRQNAELLFQQELETSPISRLHCTITDEEDHFMVRDEDSANGTYLNGERLTPVVPYRLNDGDIIELARVERGGVRLRFVSAASEDSLPPGGHAANADVSASPSPAVTQVDMSGGRF